MEITRAIAALGRAVRPQSDLARGGWYAMPGGAPITSIPTDVAAAWGFDTSADRVTRRQAMTVPAMRRARLIVAGIIGGLPLQAQRGEAGEVVTGEPFTRALATLDPRTTPQWTLTYTVDDLMFEGLSWWRVLARGERNWPTAYERLAPGRVAWGADGVVRVDGRVESDENLRRFDGPDEGLLVDGAPALRTCLLLEAAVRRNSTGMPPQDYLHPVEGAEPLTDTEVDELLAEWAEARASRSTGWLNNSVKHEVVGFDPKAGQLAESRQHQAVEIARLCNLDAQELNAPAATGMTYTNTEAKRRDLVDGALMYYMRAIASRLSMPDVTPVGTTVRLDTTGFIRGTTGDAIKTALEATGGPVMTTEEARTGLLGLPAAPTAGQLHPPAQTPAPQEARP